jgi:HEAT repeat protein
MGFDEALVLLRMSPDPNERLRMTGDWLTQGAEPGQIEAVLQAAVSDPEALVRELALRQLRERNPELWQKAFLEELKSADVDRRRTATQLLAESPEEDSLELLREATEDENIDVRYTAFQNLAQLAEKGGLEILRERLAHPDPEVRLLALESLAAKGGEFALEAARFGLNDSDEAVHARAEGIISQLGVR